MEYIPSIPSCYAQGDTKEEMIKNLTEVAKLCLRNVSHEDLSNSHFVGIQNLNDIQLSVQEYDQLRK